MRGTAVTDTFTRTVASGSWGTADTGQVWGTTSFGGTVTATDWSVNGSQGLHSVPAAAAFRTSQLSSYSLAYADIAVTGSVGVLPAGGTLELANLLTRGTGSSAYLFRLQIETSAACTALILSYSGAQIGSITVPGLTYTAGLQVRVRAQSIGKVHRMKVWKASDPEPVAWLLTVTDSAYTGAGYVSVRSGIGSGNTNTKPVVFSYDNFSSVLLPDFPKDQVPLTVLAAFGADLSADPSTWPWTDITGDVRKVEGVTITPGRRDENSQTPPASCSFALNNPSPGYPYSANNPMSTNYPYVRRNTPVWVQVNSATGFFGFINGFTPGWDTSGKLPIVNVSASGSLRRLTQGRAPLRSALYRKVTAGSALAAWSLEDGSDSTTAQPTTAGAAPLVPFGSVTPLFGKVDGPAGSAKLPDFSSKGALQGTVPTYADTGQWQVEIWFKTLEGDSSKYAAVVPIQWDLIGGTYPAADVILFIGQGAGGDGPGTIGFDISPYMASPPSESWRAGTSGIAPDGPFLVIHSLPNIQGTWRQLRVCMRQVSGNVELSAYLDNAQIGLATSGPATLGRLGKFVLNPTQGVGAYAGVDSTGIASIGHVAFYNTVADPGTYSAGLGYPGETATARLTRLCAEEGVLLTITGTSTTAMGPQGVDTLVNLLRECETADMGLLYDGFGPGLGYITRTSRYNQPAALTADMAAGQVAPPFAPADDDQRNRNLVTVTRKNGSSATYEDSTGPLGTDPLTGIGTYDSSLTVNISSDSLLDDYASWLVHLGTVVGFRYPSLSLDLAASPELIDSWTGTRLLSRLDVTGVEGRATGHAPGTVSLIAEGWTQTIGPKTWKITANTSQAQGWDVFTIADPVRGRIQAAPSTVATGVNTTATSLSVATTNTAGPLWTTTATRPSDFPFDIDVGGERMTVTAIGDALTDTFTRTVSNGWGTATSGQAYTVTGTASEYSTTGSLGRQALVTVNDLHLAYLDTGSPDHQPRISATVPVMPAGAPITVRLAGRLVDITNHYGCQLSIATTGVVTLQLVKVVGGVGSLLASITMSATHAAGATWMLALSCIGSTIGAKAWRSTTGEPGGYQLTVTDTDLTSTTRIGALSRRDSGNTNGSQSIDFDDLSVPNPQVFTVTRSVNGVVKSQPAGTTVKVWRAAALAL